MKGSFKIEDAEKKVAELKSLVEDVTPEQMLEFSRSWMMGILVYPDAKHYSLFNYIVASKQLLLRGAVISVIAPFSHWKEKGRNVKKGEKALKILAPVFSKYWDDENGRHWVSRINPAPEGVKVFTVCLKFQIVPVFDYSQTEGAEIAEIKKIRGGLQGIWSEGKSRMELDCIISLSGIPVNFYEISSKGEEGFTNGTSISLLDHRNDPRHQKQEDMITTFIHEWAHFILHFDKKGNELPCAVKEVEAETVSYVVCSFLGFKSLQAPLYIKGFEKKSSHEPRIEKVLKATETILNSIFDAKQEPVLLKSA